MINSTPSFLMWQAEADTYLTLSASPATAELCRGPKCVNPGEISSKHSSQKLHVDLMKCQQNF